MDWVKTRKGKAMSRSGDVGGPTWIGRELGAEMRKGGGMAVAVMQ